MGGTEELEDMEMGFKETVGRQGRLEKLERWCLVDVMPCGGELDEGRKDGGVGEMVFSIPDFCWS